MKLFLRHYLISMILKDPSISLRKMTEIMIERKFPFVIGKSQVGGELRMMHILSIRGIERPKMTPVNGEYRKEFAEAIQRITDTDGRIIEISPWSVKWEIYREVHCEFWSAPEHRPGYRQRTMEEAFQLSEYG
jgi:hypothetical protein